MTFNRLAEIRRLRHRLERDGYPRAQMLLLVTITGAAGFLASYGLLQAGLVTMWLRYLAALGVAYLVFLLLLWLWLRTRAEDYVDLDLPNPPSGSGHGHDDGSGYGGHGGDFGGGGAGAEYDSVSPTVSSHIPDSGAADALDVASGADELAIPLVLLAALAALLLSSLWVVYSAPVLFAELLVDGVLVVGLYRRLRHADPSHWLETAVRRTAVPVLLTALAVVIAAWAMQHYAPGAHTVAEVLEQSARRH